MSHRATTSRRPLLAAALLAGGLILLHDSPAAGDEPAQADQAERVEVGQEAPGFALTATDGESYAPGDLRGEKNLVLIFFRGTW